MRKHSQKEIRSLSNMHQAEQQLLKTHHSSNLMYSNINQSKSINSYPAKNERVNNNNAFNKMKNRPMQNIKVYSVKYNDITSTPLSKKPFQSKGSFGSFGLLNSNYKTPLSIPASYSAKSCSKPIIDYSSLNNNCNIGITANNKQSNLTNSLSLFTIKENMSIKHNNNNEHCDDNETRLKKSLNSTSSKLFHFVKLPVQIQNSQGHFALQGNNHHHHNNSSKPKEKYNHTPKRKKSGVNTNNNYIDSALKAHNPLNNNTAVMTRNDKLGHYSLKQFLSLNRDIINSDNKSSNNNKNGISEYDSKCANYNNRNAKFYSNYRKIIPNSNNNPNTKIDKSPKWNKAHSNIYQSSSKKIAINGTHQSSIQPIRNSNVDSHINNNQITSESNIKHSISKEVITSNKPTQIKQAAPQVPAIQNAFLLKLSQNQLREKEENSKPQTHQKDKGHLTMTIKVNRKTSHNTVLRKAHDNTTFIRLYSNHLTQNEIEELKQLKHPIYYHYPFKKRQKDNVTYSNEITGSFSYKHCPNYTYASFLRPNSHKSLIELAANDNLNYSEYNDEEGNYILNHKDHLLFRYEIIQLLGTGSFGEAVKCIDHKTNEVVCVKIIKADPHLFSQAMTEIKILNHIKDNNVSDSNIVKFISHFIFRGHICLVFEELDIDLYEYLKLNNYSGLEMNKIKSYATQLLFALLFMKRQGIVHCDLKPENVLLTKGDCNNVKVIDFGSSCFEYKKLYTYIQSRFYRAPEIILDNGYGIEIDMWSFGCIIAELYTGSPIFPGENERDQLMYIIDYLGLPSDKYINRSIKKEYFFDENNQPYLDMSASGDQRGLKTKLISDFLNGASKEFVDFIAACLKWEPKQRITPEEALIHEWVISGLNEKELQLHKKKREKYDVMNKDKDRDKDKDREKESVNNSITNTNSESSKATVVSMINQIKTRNVNDSVNNATIKSKRKKSKDSYCYSNRSRK